MSHRHIVPVIGLIGGIGSGKSALAHSLSERRPVCLVDGDEAGHLVLEIPIAKEQIRNRFGESVFDEAGNVIRPALGNLVFGSSDGQRQARSDLEQIVHPGIRRIFEERITAARADNDIEAVILDAAVLLEASWNDLCDAIIYVDTPETERLKRVFQQRNWTEQELKTRESSQYTLETKRQAADYVVENDGSLQEATDQLEQILENVIRSHQ